MANSKEQINSKLLLTCIIKDDSEYDLAHRMFQSFLPYVDGIAVAITGTSGKYTKLVKLIDKLGGRYIITTPTTHPEIYTNGKFANFAAARNASFALADSMGEYDFYLWADVDDVLIGGEQLQQVANRAKELKMDTVLFTYWYAIKLRKDNTYDESCVQIEHSKERLLRPHVFKWVSRLHEVPVSVDNNYKPTYTLFSYKPDKNQTVVWAHLSDDKRFEEHSLRNVEILKQQIEDEQYKDPRTVLYLAKTYFDMRKSEYDDKALPLFEMYLHGKHPSGWAEERSNAWEYIANIYGRKGEHNKAIEALHEGLKEYPNKHMLMLLLAMEYAEVGKFEQSDFWLNTALKMDAPETRTTIGNPMEIKFMAASLKYNQAMRSQNLNDAIYWQEKRLATGQIEDDGMLATLKDLQLMNKAAEWVFNYSKWLKDHGHTDKVQKLLEALPYELGREPFAHYIASEVNPPKVWPSNSIVYYASWGVEHFEGWSAKSLQTGIGGSETAVIELAKRWAKMGYDVTVFGDPRDDEGDIDGVHYRPWYEANLKDEFNILILWRSPHLLDKELKAKKLFMDLHDVASQIDWTPERMNKIDKVFFKSKFHRSMVPKLPDEKAVIISNGITI